MAVSNLQGLSWLTVQPSPHFQQHFSSEQIQSLVVNKDSSGTRKRVDVSAHLTTVQGVLYENLASLQIFNTCKKGNQLKKHQNIATKRSNKIKCA
jgi:hypothetical protein